ncbi:MAG: hypothetical protein J5644_08465 [Bacteroidales bacterium]|nr:hypothetical protein [Bacteroidales bacterium]
MGYNTAKEKMEENNPQTLQKKKGCVKWLLIILVVLLAFVIIISIITSKGTNDSVKESEGTNTELSATTEKADSTLWEIKSEMDEMTDSQNIWASIKSDNYINQDFPYEGNTHAYITVRYMKKIRLRCSHQNR